MQSSQPPILALPNVVLLLIHLHLLACPFTNNPECDEHIFDPRIRNLGKRTKYMEEIVFFLISKLAGPGEARSILPMYPCLEPSDTVAFRNASTKYIEALRTSSVRPAQLPIPKDRKPMNTRNPTLKSSASSQVSLSNSSNKSSGLEASRRSPSNITAGPAWWWKDVLPRKSLLEECTGEKFERLLLALSTHILFKLSPQIESLIGNDRNPSGPSLLSLPTFLESQATSYMNLLHQALALGKVTRQQSTILELRCQQLSILRSRLVSTSHENSDTEPSPLPRLFAIRDFKRNLLVDGNSLWAGSSGSTLLEFVTQLLELRTQSKKESEQSSNLDVFDRAAANPATQIPYPLPIAAAHHPMQMKTLSTLSSIVFQPQASDSDNVQAAEVKRPNAAVMKLIDEQSELSSKLQDFLRRTEQSASKVINKLKELDAQCPNREIGHFHLWTEVQNNEMTDESEDVSVCFQPLFEDDDSTSHEARVSKIRMSLNPKPQTSSETTQSCITPSLPPSRLPTLSKPLISTAIPSPLQTPLQSSPSSPIFSPLQEQSPVRDTVVNRAPISSTPSPLSTRKTPRSAFRITSQSGRKRLSTIVRPIKTPRRLTMKGPKKSLQSQRKSVAEEMDDLRRGSLDLACDEIVKSVKRDAVLTTPPTIKGKRLFDSNNKPISVMRSRTPRRTGSSKTLFTASRRSPSLSDSFSTLLPPLDFDASRKYSIPTSPVKYSMPSSKSQPVTEDPEENEWTDEEGSFDDGPSITLRDILLRAGGMGGLNELIGEDANSFEYGFDMIKEEEGQDDIADQTLGWD